MSKHKNNVNPDHYKTRGRDPQGRDVVHQVERAQYAEAAAREKRNHSEDTKDDSLPQKNISGQTGGSRPDQPDEEPDTWGGEGGAGDHDPSKTRS